MTILIQTQSAPADTPKCQPNRGHFTTPTTPDTGVTQSRETRKSILRVVPGPVAFDHGYNCFWLSAADALGEAGCKATVHGCGFCLASFWEALGHGRPNPPSPIRSITSSRVEMG